MNILKIFKYAQKGAQKGAKKAKRRKSGAVAAPAWPEGTKVGVFGHENSGKTVFFTALYTQSKTTNNFHVSVRDNATANEFFKNDMAIKGVDVDSGGTGTIAAKSVPKRFPDHTVKDLVLQFTAILDGSKKMPVVTYDYNGKAASISERSDEAEKIHSFMEDADGLLFFFDPKILGADPEVQARVSSFVNILELIVSLKSRLPIPVGLVITKADTLPGYSGEDKTILIRPKDEQVIAEDYETFLERVLGFQSLSDDREWASSVRNILVKLREFIRVVVGRTLDFQIFFVSGTGNKPEKIGAEVGRSIYAPPDKVNPCGVTEPFHWILSSIVRSRRLSLLRRVTGFIVAASIVWIALYSLPFIIHFAGLLRAPYRVESKVLRDSGGSHQQVSPTSKKQIINAYKRYSNAWLVKTMFPEYQVRGERMRELYSGYGQGADVDKLDIIVNELTNVIRDEKLRPTYNGAKKRIDRSEDVERLLSDLKEMNAGDEKEATDRRAGRVRFLWGLYEQYLANPSEATTQNAIWDQVNADANRADCNESEQKFGQTLMAIVTNAAPTPRGAGTGLGEYESLKAQINGKDATAEFVLGEAMEKLQDIRSLLVPGVHDGQINAINRFIAEARSWDKKQKYSFLVQSVPNDGHIHYEVTESGESPRWNAKGNQYFQGDKIDLEWQPGDEIHIAFDEATASENWGKSSSDMVVLDGKYALFDMEGRLTLNRGTTIQFSYKNGLKERLPKLQ
jgi:GTPase SAR1 family protein